MRLISTVGVDGHHGSNQLLRGIIDRGLAEPRPDDLIGFPAWQAARKRATPPA
jgi:hypothetical protein